MIGVGFEIGEVSTRWTLVVHDYTSWYKSQQQNVTLNKLPIV